ncbi:MAG TPA: SAM-dependent methyltransferase, partial [Candidatus Dormibacteraeota bacterium]
MSRVRLVGIGPGHPGLATVQAVEAIKDAEIIRCCDGCGDALLHLASAHADIGPLESAEEIVRLARTGRKVAVLFPGNPYAFSNGSDIAEKLERAEIDFEAVPGLIVELAAPVMSGIPLTIEGQSASIGFGLVKGAETVVLRLASGWWKSGITALMADGRTPETPAALILNPGQPGQHRVSAPLGELARKAATYGLRGDALLVLGPGVEMADRLDTLSKRPLHGRRILITRARHQIDPFRRELVELGAAVIEIPTIEISPMPTDERVQSAIARLSKTALVIFASANAVDIFFRMVLETGGDARALHPSKLCAIGQETAES